MIMHHMRVNRARHDRNQQKMLVCGFSFFGSIYFVSLFFRNKNYKQNFEN